MKKHAVIYTTPICPYCVRAKILLDREGVLYQEIDVSKDPELRKKMSERAGGRTSVPQIFIGDYHVGGCDDLYQAYQTGKLQDILGKQLRFK